jgi:hypothetical protein
MTENPSVPDNGPEKRPQEAPRPHAEQGPTFAAAEPHVQDLSAEIVRAVRRSAGERVTCRRIVGDKYRCNWWSAQSTDGYDNPNMTGQLVTTHRVQKSELLRVTKTHAGLVIEAVSGEAR